MATCVYCVLSVLFEAESTEWDCDHPVVLFSSDLMQGVSEGITQTARRGGRENRSVFVWNFPVNVTFKSTNPFGCESWEVHCTGCMATQCC